MEQRIIQVQDEADDTLTELCLATDLGRGRMLQVAFEHAANSIVLGAQAPPIQAVIDRIKSERPVPECVRESLEIAKIRAARAPKG